MSAQNFKKGDKVRVINNIEVNKNYDGFAFIDHMEEYKNKILTIDKYIDGYKCNYYNIIEDKGQWSWTEGMFELVDDYSDRTIDCLDIVLEKLGLQLGEVFEIEINPNEWAKYKLTKNGFYNVNKTGDFCCPTVFLKLLIGQFKYRKIKQISKPTADEQKVLEALKVLGYNYITRDENGALKAFKEIPIKKTPIWNTKHYFNGFVKDFWNQDLLSIPLISFGLSLPFISWEDEEPYEIK